MLYLWLYGGGVADRLYGGGVADRSHGAITKPNAC